jgi:prolyl-tRNA synthetase
VRFADAELIGCPVRVTVGKRTATEGTVDVQVRRGREADSAPAEEAAARVVSLLDGMAPTVV